MSKSAAKRYAKAIYNIAEEDKSTEALCKDMQLIASTLGANKNLRTVLNSPVISVDQKLKITQEVFKSLSKTSLQLFTVLASNKRIQILGLVANAYVERYEEANNIQRAEVTTAVALDAKLEQEIQHKIKQLTGTEAELTTNVDSNLIGGFLLRIKDMQLDATVATQLQRVKRELVN
jgi:F-type H+-transporting ATPase subunit delta